MTKLKHVTAGVTVLAGVLITLFAVKRKRKSVDANSTVSINWGEQFRPSYVRAVVGVKTDTETDEERFESITYLTKEHYNTPNLYNHGDQYIISHYLDDVKSTGNMTPCQYYLLEVNVRAVDGYTILASTRETGGYPYPENKLFVQALKLLHIGETPNEKRGI